MSNAGELLHIDFINNSNKHSFGDYSIREYQFNNAKS